jgi:hypothetical protein
MAEVSQPPSDMMGFLDYYLVQKAPFQIPDGGREWIVKYGPWIAVVLLVLTLPPLLFALGIGALVMPFGSVAYAAGFTYITILILVNVGLTVMALPGLFARKIAGWNLLFYAQLVGFLTSLLSGSVIGGLIGLLISLYILFQVRGLYRA